MSTRLHLFAAARPMSTPVTDATSGNDAAAATTPDGRSARANRTRQSIVDALLSLLEEGDLQPTANRIAERAGISLRLIYHHFGDLESLFRATAERQAERLFAVIEPIDTGGTTLGQRADAFCAQRARTLEWMTPVRRAAILHEPFSEELRRAREAFSQLGRAQVDELFAADLAGLEPGERAETLVAVHVAASWNTWDALRSEGLDVDAAESVLRRMVGALLGVCGQRQDLPSGSGPTGGEG